MTTLRISEVAERIGVPATTLRYYEKVGLLAGAPRTRNGYRAYDERDLARLRFIARAKRLDLTLDDLRELAEAWDSDQCAHVQRRMARIVEARRVETQSRIAELAELDAQLQATTDRLAAAPAAGPCDDDCACVADATPAVVSSAPPPRAAPADEPVIECTLDQGDVQGRVGEWRDALARATERVPLDDGVALRFPHDIDLTAALARLCAAEHACCSFFRFALAIDSHGVRLEVRSPPEAWDVTAAVFGTPGEPAPTS
ncbi:MerR family transcriptional regulator [soil metagenome]